MPALTVLMPVYNAERFLQEAIDSILQQTYADFEFLIIDDGSTDGSVQIIQSYHDPRIRLFQNENNLGISATLNKGIALAQANIIARMDADDISYPDRLEKQLAYLQSHPNCAMVSSMAKVITEKGELVRVDKLNSEHYYYNLTFICWIYHSTVMYRKAAVQAVGSYTATYSEDFELFWQLSRKYKFYNLPEVLLDYRVTSQSLHQVSKKEEYEQAQQEQVLRNIRYFTGSNYALPDNYLASYRHNFVPLTLPQIISCIRELDYITLCILQKSNVNHNTQAIKRAALYKRRYIMAHYAKSLPLHHKVYLYLSLESYRSLISYLKSYLKKKPFSIQNWSSFYLTLFKPKA